MSQNYIVKNPAGLLVRAQMDTTNSTNILRKMSNGEGFTVFQLINQPNGYVWGRLSDDPGNLQQQYACISILGRTAFAVPELPSIFPIPINSQWGFEADAFLRTKGYMGVKP